MFLMCFNVEHAFFFLIWNFLIFNWANIIKMAGKSYFYEIFFLVIFIQASIGKEEAILGEFPWTVSLRLSGFLGHDCGAAILNSV